MKKLLIISTVLFLMIVACNLRRDSFKFENFSELIKYQASPLETNFTYRLELGDTVQMALQNDVIYLTASQHRDGLHVTVLVDHAPNRSKK